MESAPLLCEWHRAMNLSAKSTAGSELFDALGWKQHIYILFMTHLSGVFLPPQRIFLTRGNSLDAFSSQISQPMPFYSPLSRVALAHD